MARMTSDARRLASIISWGLVDFLWGFLLMIGILLISFFINWRLALIMTALLPIFIVIAIFYRKKILKEHREVRKINSHITASYNESFMAANTTKTLILEDDNATEFNDLAERYKRRAIRAAFFSSLFWPTILFLGYVGVAIVAYAGENGPTFDCYFYLLIILLYRYHKFLIGNGCCPVLTDLQKLTR